MEVDLVAVRMNSVSTQLQRLCLPVTLLPAVSDKWARVELTDSSTYLCRVVHRELLEPGFCLLERTVACGGSARAIVGGARVRRITAVPKVRYLKTLRVEVVLTSVEELVRWRSRRQSRLSLLKQLLRLFVVNADGCLLNLKHFEAASQLGVRAVRVVGDSGSSVGRVVGSTEVVVDGLISWDRFALRFAARQKPLAGNGVAYEQLKLFLSSRQAAADNHLAANFDFSQLMVIGPGGSGKKSMIRKATEDCGALLLRLDCTETLRPKPGETESALLHNFERAKLLATEGLVVFLLERLETVCRKAGRTLNQVNGLLDSVARLSNLVVVTAIVDPHLIHESAKTTSRMHNVIFLGAPSEAERLDMLTLLTSNDMLLGRSRLASIAQMTPGYVLADLALVVANTRRCLHKDSNLRKPSEKDIFCLMRSAVNVVEPSSVRGEFGLVKANSSIDQIGGLEPIKKTLLQAVHWPLLFPEAFERLHVKPSSGVLLYGPPGCAKTSLARAMAAGSHVTFLAVSAADLFSPFVGDTERVVSSLFQRARAAAPTLLFIDEIDALVGNRESEQRGTQERVLSSFLIEMDGIGVQAEAEYLRGLSESRVVIVAATNRPHVIDNALLRPGRLDKLIHVPPPNLAERHDVLRVVTSNMPLEDTVNLQELAERTELYSGADLSNLCREAAFHAMTTRGVEVREISHDDFLAALQNAPPSLTVAQIDWYRNFNFG